MVSRILRVDPFFLAVALILLAMFLFDVMGAIVKYMGTTYPSQQLAVFRNFFGLFPSLIVLFMAQDWHAAGRPLLIRQWKLGLVRGGLVGMAQFCLYLSYTRLEFATASTLAFASPLFITLLSIPILKLQVGAMRWLAVIVGFAGIVMIMRPGSDVFSLFAFLPVIAAFGYAAASVLVRLVDTNVPSATINLYSTVGALFCSIVLLFSTTGYIPIASVNDWLLLILLGAVGGSAVLTMIVAYRLTQPSNLAPFEYFGIPFSFAIGWYVFAEAPFGRLFPGAILIVIGGLLIVWRERKRAKRRT